MDFDVTEKDGCATLMSALLIIICGASRYIVYWNSLQLKPAVPVSNSLKLCASLHIFFCLFFPRFLLLSIFHEIRLHLYTVGQAGNVIQEALLTSRTERIQ